MYIMSEAKNLGKKGTLTFAGNILPLVRTSYSAADIKELIELYLGMKDGVTTEQYSFPFEYEGTKLKDGLWYAVPNNLRNNVIELQKTIFGVNDYIPSKVVENINEAIEKKSGLSGK